METLLFSYYILGLIISIKLVSMFLNWIILFTFISNKDQNDPLFYYFGIYAMYNFILCLYFFYTDEYFSSHIPENSDTTATAGEFLPKDAPSSTEHNDLKTTEKEMSIDDQYLLASWIALTMFVFILGHIMK